MAQEKPGKKVIAQNREARHEYFVIEALETGVELVGTEVKSLRAGGVNLKDSWADIDDGELILKGMHISPYEQGNIVNKDPRRPRRLLAHKSEIRHLQQQIFGAGSAVDAAGSVLYLQYPVIHKIHDSFSLLSFAL